MLFDSLLHANTVYICAMKRMIYFLLAIFTIFLALIPCQDEVKYATENDRISELRATSFDASPLHVADQCSPFCVCACCAHSTCMHILILELIPKDDLLIDSKMVFTYTCKISVSEPIAIWQPPQGHV